MTDTNKWEDPFFSNLTSKMKLVWFYLLDKCDHAGIIEFSERVFSFNLGEKITKEEILESFSDKIYVTEKGKWFLKTFVSFQYKELNQKSNPKKAVIDRLQKENIPVEFYSSLLTLNEPLNNHYPTLDQPLTKGYPTLQDKAKDKDKALDTDMALDADDKLYKDFDKFLSFFPIGKNNHDPHSITIWNNLSSRDKQICLQLTPLYIRHHISTKKENYIKNAKKFLEEGFYRQLFEYQSRYLGQKVTLQVSEESKVIPFTQEELLDGAYDFNN